MRITKLFILAAVISVSLFELGTAQCKEPNIVATQIPQSGRPIGGIPIGQPLVIEYKTPVNFDGKFVYTVASAFDGKVPLGNGYCLPVRYPFFLMGINPCRSGTATMKYQVPNTQALVGLTLYVGGMVADGTIGGTGASNQVRCTIWEDWPL